MPKEEITYDEVAALRASAVVLMQQAERMLAKMEGTLYKSGVNKAAIAEELAKHKARRMKRFLKK